MKHKWILILTTVSLLACSLLTPTATPLPSPAPITEMPPTATPFTPPATPQGLPDPVLFDIPWDDRALFKDGLVPEWQSVLEQLPGASVYHIRLDVSDDLRTVTGQQEVLYTNMEPAALDEIYLRLFPNILGGNLHVTFLQVNGQPVNTRYELDNSLLVLKLDTPLEPGSQVVIRINFDDRVPDKIELNYGVFAATEQMLAFAHGYPMLAVYDSTGWNAELPPQDGDIVYADASFYLVEISAPSALTLAASGSEISRSDDGSRQTIMFANGPARDFYFTGRKGVSVATKTAGEILVKSYYPSDNASAGQLALETAAAALEIFGRRYAPYPYTEFDVAVTPNLALGIEYPGITAITDRLYSPEKDFKSANETTLLESTIAHEVGHQWFYNLVGDDQLDEPWLDESLTQFITYQYYADRYGNGDGFKDSLYSRWKGVDDARIPVGLPVARYTGKEYGAIVYGRGALFFFALIDQIGQQNFDAFMKEYTETYAWRIATTDGLKSTAEHACSCDLTPLFEEWIYP